MNPSPKQQRQESDASTGPRSAVATVAVAGVGLCCLTGSEAFALFGAVAAQLRGARAHASLEAPLPGKKELASLLFAPVPDLEGLDTPHERMAALAQSALGAAAEGLLEKTPGDSILVLTLIPESTSPRGANLDPAKLQQELASCHPRVGSAEFRFAPAGRGAVQALGQVCAELQQGRWQAVVFGGTDSLVDTVTLSDLAGRGDAMAQGGTEGILAGEGAAYLVLEKPPCTRSMVRINALCAASEPHPGQAHDQPMTGMTKSIQCVIQETGITPEKLDSLVSPFGATTAESLEWHQVIEAVWPRRDNVARNFEVLRPATALGHTGAAALPLGLALGCARFEFYFPGVERLLVCEAGQGSPRGAVLLKREPSEATASPATKGETP
jgi:3-oxoacyl-[acyl-carrier-protein] synthase I